jgi:hypothetical protein
MYVIPSAARDPFRVVGRLPKGSLVAALLGMTIVLSPLPTPVIPSAARDPGLDEPLP